MISRERTACGIGAVQARGQTDDQQPGTTVAKRRLRSTMIVWMIGCGHCEMLGETRAARAISIVPGVGNASHTMVQPGWALIGRILFYTIYLNIQSLLSKGASL